MRWCWLVLMLVGGCSCDSDEPIPSLAPSHLTLEDCVAIRKAGQRIPHECFEPLP